MGCQWGFLLGIFLRIHEVEATWNHESWAILMGKPLIQPDVRTARTANPATVLRTAKLVVADGAFQKVGSQWVCNQMIMTWVCLQTFKLREPQIDAPCFECEENCTVKRTCSEYWGRIRNPEYRQFFSRAASQCRKHHAFFLAALFIFWAQTLMCLPKCNSLFFPGVLLFNQSLRLIFSFGSTCLNAPKLPKWNSGCFRICYGLWFAQSSQKSETRTLHRDSPTGVWLIFLHMIIGYLQIIFRNQAF